jgi:hypothetical protein
MQQQHYMGSSSGSNGRGMHQGVESSPVEKLVLELQAKFQGAVQVPVCV